MTMLKTHEDAIKSSNTAYHEFLLYYKAKEKLVYGFVEGKEDPSFYRSLIQNNLPNGWAVKLIQAGNKNKVFQVYDDMNWTVYSPRRVCFFVDRDLMEFLGSVVPTAENIYITDKYSIENDLAEFSLLEIALEEVMNVTCLTPDERQKIKQMFEINCEVFSNVMTPIMAQIILWKRSEEQPCLDDIQPKDFFSFNSYVITLKEEFEIRDSRVEYIGQRCNLTCSSSALLTDTEREFREKKGPEKYIRGKYVIWFFVECILRIYEFIGELCAKYSKKPKVHVSLSQKNALIILGPRARMPESLRDFIKRTYLAYIQELEVIV